MKKFLISFLLIISLSACSATNDAQDDHKATLDDPDSSSENSQNTYNDVPLVERGVSTQENFPSIDSIEDVVLTDEMAGAYSEWVNHIYNTLSGRYPDDKFYPLAIPPNSIEDTSLSVVFTSDKMIELASQYYNKRRVVTDWVEMSPQEILAAIYDEAINIQEADIFFSHTPSTISTKVTWNNENPDATKVADNYVANMRRAEVFQYMSDKFNEFFQQDVLLDIHYTPKAVNEGSPYSFNSSVVELLGKEEDWATFNITIVAKMDTSSEKEVYEMTQAFGRWLSDNHKFYPDSYIVLKIVPADIDLSSLNDAPMFANRRNNIYLINDFQHSKTYSVQYFLKNRNGDINYVIEHQKGDDTSDVVNKIWDESKQAFIEIEDLSSLSHFIAVE